MPRIPRTAIVTLALLGVAVVCLQAVHERSDTLRLASAGSQDLLYVRSPEVLKHATLSYRTLAADLYWIRAVQHYGATKLSTDPHKQYDLLYPLLDLTTALDPKFTIAYRFGAIFLAEPYPNGPGRTDLAIALLQKGLAAEPDKWEYAEDIGFVYYWWREDYKSAAAWFQRAGSMPGAPNWLKPVAAVTLAEGGNRASSRQLWQGMLDSEQEWLRRNARYRLTQLDAMDQIEALGRLVHEYERRAGRRPRAWEDLGRAGLLRALPRDPTGAPYRLDPDSGAVTLGPDSSLNPLPAVHPASPVR